MKKKGRRKWSQQWEGWWRGLFSRLCRVPLPEWTVTSWEEISAGLEPHLGRNPKMVAPRPCCFLTLQKTIFEHVLNRERCTQWGQVFLGVANIGRPEGCGICWMWMLERWGGWEWPWWRKHLRSDSWIRASNTRRGRSGQDDKACWYP